MNRSRSPPMRRRSPSPYRSMRDNRESYGRDGYSRDYYPSNDYYDRRGYSGPSDYRGSDRGGDRGGDRMDRDRDRGGRGYDNDRYDRNERRERPVKQYEIIKGDEEDRNTTKCLYIGNLPYSFGTEDVSEMFEKCGKLASVSVPIDRFTGRNKGFAFLAFEERKDAEDAKAKYEAFPVDGRTLRIDWDVGREKKDLVKGIPPRESRPPREGRQDLRGEPRHDLRDEPRQMDPRDAPRMDPRSEAAEQRADRSF